MYTYRILLIENNPIFFPLWHSILSQVMWRYKLDWAASENAAKKMLEKTSYDIVISDIFLSNCKTSIDIWKSTNPNDCSFIFVTSVPEKTFKELLADEDRPYFFLAKPLNVGRAMQLIHRLIQAEEQYRNIA